MGLAGTLASSGSESVLGAMGRLYKPSATRRLVVWCHEANGSYLSTWTPTNNALPLMQALADMGCPTVVLDAGGTATWGNDTAQTRLGAARTWANTQYGPKTDKVVLVGVSMGGLLALNWARANPTLVAAICLFYPAVNLQAIHDGTGGSGNGAATTEAAYGGSLSTFNAAVAAHDPAQHATDYAGVPIKMWYSTADTVVGTANQTSFAAAVGGSAFASRSLGAVGHADMTQIPPSEPAEFLAAYV